MNQPDLKEKLGHINNFYYCQSVATNWLNEATSAILKVPSVIIKKEYNYLINPQHPDYKLIKLDWC